MKKLYFILCLLVIVAVFLVGCQSRGSEMMKPASTGATESGATSNTSETESTQAGSEEAKWDKIPMVMVDGKLYYDTGKEHIETDRSEVMDGEIASTVDRSEVPTENNQSNFGTGFQYQYGKDNTIEIVINGKWIVFEQREGSGSQVRFGDQMIDANGLSKETLNWLAWYNSLSKEEQMAVSALPSELYTEMGFAQTEDAETSAQEDQLRSYPPEKVEGQ